MIKVVTIGHVQFDGIIYGLLHEHCRMQSLDSSKVHQQQFQRI